MYDEARVEALIARLVDAPPQTLLALDAAVGPLGLDPREAEDAAWTGGAIPREDVSPEVLAMTAVCRPAEVHHRDPAHSGDLALTAFRVLLAGGLAPCLERLGGRFGRPRQLTENGASVLGFGPFYLVLREDEACDLAWCASPPACAVRAHAARDPRAFDAFLAFLPAAVAELRTIEDADRFRHALPPDVGVRTAPRSLVSVWSLVFAPPVEARALREAWSWSHPFAVSGDIYQMSWDVRLQAGPVNDQFDLATVPTTYPLFGPWTVRARLMDRPPGPVPDLRTGPSPAYDLTRYDGRVAIVDFAAAWLEPLPGASDLDALLADDRVDVDLAPGEDPPGPLPELPPVVPWAR